MSRSTKHYILVQARQYTVLETDAIQDFRVHSQHDCTLAEHEVTPVSIHVHCTSHHQCVWEMAGIHWYTIVCHCYGNIYQVHAHAFSFMCTEEDFCWTVCEGGVLRIKIKRTRSTLNKHYKSFIKV